MTFAPHAAAQIRPSRKRFRGRTTHPCLSAVNQLRPDSHLTIQTTRSRMHRYFHLAMNFLCLVALVASLGGCDRAYATAPRACAHDMSTSMPMPASEHQSLPPCCVAHPLHSPAQVAATTTDLPVAALVSTPFSPDRFPDLLTAQRTLLTTPLTSRLTFPLPLRI